MFVVFTKVCKHTNKKVWNTWKLTDTHRHKQSSTQRRTQYWDSINNVLNLRFHCSKVVFN